MERSLSTLSVSLLAASDPSPNPGQPLHVPEAEQRLQEKSPCIHVMYKVDNYTSLDIDFGSANEHALEFFDHAVARDPKILKNHIQRINVIIRVNRDPNILYGALLDLFIALEDKGIPLRNRLLLHCRQYLIPKHFSALHNKIESGVKITDIMPLSRSSMLSKAYTGYSISLEATSTAVAEIDPIEEAGQYLEYGQVQEARILLEKSVIKQPWRKDLQDDLLEIYRVTRDHENCSAMYQRLANCFIPDHQAWTDASEYIQQAVEPV